MILKVAIKQNLKIDVSLSHIKDCAVATAVAIYEE